VLKFAVMSDDAAEMTEALVRLGLVPAGTTVPMTPLTGGVSSDIWRADLADGPVCIKRALPKLRVEADWRAPVGRNIYEARWMETVRGFLPEAVPELRAHDPDVGLFVMAYLDPADYPLWKGELMAGRVDTAVAGAVGNSLGRIHARTAGDALLAERFDSGAIFHAIRLEPYLLATARVHPDRADALTELSETTAKTQLALIHGDVSPKNILAGPQGPVFLDAECACYGDPAFDLAFCLNHLLLKCLHRPDLHAAYLACFDGLAERYMQKVDWEDPAGLECRAARLLPGLLLARVDGKSPVEYVNDEGIKDRVRTVTREALTRRVDRVAEIRARWLSMIGEIEGYAA
jgi:tRNA A-37 threonylcarbamoyl transferase component Bud32